MSKLKWKYINLSLRGQYETFSLILSLDRIWENKERRRGANTHYGRLHNHRKGLTLSYYSLAVF